MDLPFSEDIAKEYLIASRLHGVCENRHNAYVDLMCEMDGLRVEVSKKRIDKNKIKRQFLQIAAMCVRSIVDLKL